VSAFLDKVSERDVELVASPPRQVLDRLLNARAKRTRRGRLLLLAAASVAVLALGGTVWTAIQNSRQETQAAAPAMAPATEPLQRNQESRPFTDAQPDLPPSSSASARPDRTAIAGSEFTGVNSALGYHATIMAWPIDGGTELGVQINGVPAGTSCRLVVIGQNGRRDATDSWVIGDSEYRERAAFKTTTTLSMKDILRFDVVDGVGTVLIRIDAAGK
jgi:hypothetical protein